MKRKIFKWKLPNSWFWCHFDFSEGNNTDLEAWLNLAWLNFDGNCTFFIHFCAQIPQKLEQLHFSEWIADKLLKEYFFWCITKFNYEETKKRSFFRYFNRWRNTHLKYNFIVGSFKKNTNDVMWNGNI